MNKEQSKLPKVELHPLADLIQNAKQMHEDATFNISKNIKDPKRSRHNRYMYDWTGSVLHCLEELETLKNKEEK